MIMQVKKIVPVCVVLILVSAPRLHAQDPLVAARQLYASAEYEKALQLLAYDIHGGTYPIAREIVKKPPNQAAKIEALRLLSADAQSAPVFEKLLRNKSEATEVRRMCASALHAIAPQKLQEHAREIVMDESENDEVKATSMTALTQFGDTAAVAADKTLRKRIVTLKKSGRSKNVKDSAGRFIDKYGE